MIRVRVCTMRCRCHNSCRRSRFSQLGTQIFGKSSFNISLKICCASSRSVLCLRFLRRLENLRRRANVAAVHEMGRAKYDRINTEWHRYEKDLRKCCINCTLRHTLIYARLNGDLSRTGGMQRINRLFVGEVVKIAEKELKAEELPMPETALLFPV